MLFDITAGLGESSLKAFGSPGAKCAAVQMGSIMAKIAIPLSSQLKEAVDAAINLVREIQTVQALHQSSLKPCSFWYALSNATYDMAVIDWCKLFGSGTDAKQPTHWKSIVKDPAVFMRENSRLSV